LLPLRRRPPPHPAAVTPSTRPRQATAITVPDATATSDAISVQDAIDAAASTQISLLSPSPMPSPSPTPPLRGPSVGEMRRSHGGFGLRRAAPDPPRSALPDSPRRHRLRCDRPTSLSATSQRASRSPSPTPSPTPEQSPSPIPATRWAEACRRERAAAALRTRGQGVASGEGEDAVVERPSLCVKMVPRVPKLRGRVPPPSTSTGSSHQRPLSLFGRRRLGATPCTPRGGRCGHREVRSRRHRGKAGCS
ncbi:unnamed protein product, partial [Urochloa humidicola]